jgi:hypothetical protein
VAHSKKKRRAASRSNAGTRRRRVNRGGRRHSTRRRNPAGIPLTDYAFGGAGVLAGFVGSAAIPQMLLGSGNLGMVGYAVTAAATVGLAILANMVFPRKKAVTFGVAAGGAANLIRRVISDNTSYGPFLSNPGMGDYMVANWGPPLMTNGLQQAMAAPYGMGVPAAMSSSGVSSVDMMDIGGGFHRPC